MENPELHSDLILNEAIQKGATDIHFTPKADDISIHFRINGYRWFYKNLTYDLYHSLISYYKFISGMDIAEKRIPQSGTIMHHQQSQAFDLRLSTLPTKLMESLAIRILTKDYYPKLENLFLFPSQGTRLMGWIKQKAGMILFTGPTGSGKTTTMYALLKSSIEHYGFQAITLEDPVEQSIHDLLQVQVNERAGFDYDVGLKAALRHDPDIIMVGEIRDADTARFALRAALTGHLVMSTVHAKNAYGTIARLNEMGLSKTDLKETIIGIASQQLIPINHSPNNKVRGRAAIAELLTGDYLQKALNGFPPEKRTGYQSFDSLRRKAYALGYTHLSS